MHVQLETSENLMFAFKIRQAEPRAWQHRTWPRGDVCLFKKPAPSASGGCPLSLWVSFNVALMAESKDWERNNNMAQIEMDLDYLYALKPPPQYTIELEVGRPLPKLLKLFACWTEQAKLHHRKGRRERKNISLGSNWPISKSPQ